MARIVSPNTADLAQAVNEIFEMHYKLDAQVQQISEDLTRLMDDIEEYIIHNDNEISSIRDDITSLLNRVMALEQA